MRTRTLAQLREEALERSDNVGNGAITTAFANTLVNQGIAELVDLLVASDPERYYATETISTTAGTASYAPVATTVRSVIGVSLVVDDQRIPIEPLLIQERLGPRNYTPAGRYPHTRYALRGNGAGTRLHFDPDPGTNTYELIYVAQPANLTADGDTFDGFAGWEDYVVLYVAIALKDKLEEDSSFLRADLAKIRERIKCYAEERDAGSPPRIANVRRRHRYF
jgi:hypothetical protein